MPHDDPHHKPSGLPHHQQDRHRRPAANVEQEDGFDESDPLWDMLGKAPMAPADPWLPARTMARLRREIEPAPLWQRILRAPAFVFGALAIAMGAGVATGLVLNPTTGQPSVAVISQPQLPTTEPGAGTAGSSQSAEVLASAATPASEPSITITPPLPADMDEALNFLVASDNIGGMELDIWGDSSDL